MKSALLNKLQYRQRIFLYLTTIFIVFTVLVLFFQFNREKEFKRQQMEIRLDQVAELTHNFIKGQNLKPSMEFAQLDSLYRIVPMENLRVTIISRAGQVIYDTEVSRLDEMENHLQRPEIKSAQQQGKGTRIRESSTTGYEYYYFARAFDDMFVRVAAHYDAEVKNFLAAEKLFLLYLIVLFLVTWSFLSIITRNLSGVLIKLKEFATQLSKGEELDQGIKFPQGEFGEISAQILDIYENSKLTKSKLEIEKNKLFSHLVALNEGIAFYTKRKKKILRNNHFIQFINIISTESKISEEDIFRIKEFSKANDFIEAQLQSDAEWSKQDLPTYEEVIYKDKRTFHLHVIFFSDKSFEVVIRDVTRLEKQKILKEQITSNIAHELKTPITIILGYLELLKNNHLEEEEYKRYISKAYLQSERLSELIQDISLLHKISEAKERFAFDQINLNDLIHEVKDSFTLSLQEANIKVKIRLSKPIMIQANRSLLTSVFYNLFDNAIKYGGQDIKIEVNNYLEDSNYFYFSFTNTGKSIDKKHFLRIFERFYRVDEDRSRERGGTGLGLSIVKNAIQLHGGEITASNHKDGGVEFMFTLAKRPN